MKNLNIDQLETVLLEKRRQVKSLKQDIQEIEDHILDRYGEAVREELRSKPDMTGTVTLQDKVKITIPKRVKWDQEQLQQLYQKIKAGNEDPDEYIDVAYKVTETSYEAWPTPIKEQFKPARTVEHGKAKVEFV